MTNSGQYCYTTLHQKLQSMVIYLTLDKLNAPSLREEARLREKLPVCLNKDLITERKLLVAAHKTNEVQLLIFNDLYIFFFYIYSIQFLMRYIITHFIFVIIELVKMTSS